MRAPGCVFEAHTRNPFSYFLSNAVKSGVISSLKQSTAVRGSGLVSLGVCVLLVVLLRLPFLNQAIQGDDLYYLAGAQHALIDPLHPNHARYVFGGQMVDMRGHPHPPLDSWILAGLLAIFGDVNEATFHAVYLLFPVITVVAVWWLARRFAGNATWPTNRRASHQTGTTVITGNSRYTAKNVASYTSPKIASSP